MPSPPSPFESFWMGGFECASHRRPDGVRVDVVGASGHDRAAASDYRQLQAHGVRTVRDGLRWPLVETAPGRYDWASWKGQLRAARETGTQVVWDLCHYGIPDDLDVWRPEFVERFAAFARAAAGVHRLETDAVPWWCPINEISFWSWAGGDAGFFPPFAHGRGFELKVQLARAALAAADAVRDVDPRARFLWAEPAIHVACDPARPSDAPHAEGHRLAQFQAWDLLAGRLWPQVGGREHVLDVLGVNYYPTNQWVHGGPPIGRGHALYRPFRAILAEVAERYGRPVVVSETGTEGDARADWIRYVAAEVDAARRSGVRVDGVCWYPVADHPGWDDDRPCPNGLLGYLGDDGARPVHRPLAAELAWQRRRSEPHGIAERLADPIRTRARPRLFGPPSPALRASVVVPARDEARRLPALVAALAAQRDLDGGPFPDGSVEVLVLLNNCVDRSAEGLAEAAARHPVLDLRVASVTLAPHEAHVGRARQLLMDAACARLWGAGGPDGVILSTDADTEPAPGWIARTLFEVGQGVDAVGGRAMLRADERAALDPGVRRLYLLDLAYRRALEELRALYAPEPWDPLPRHHHQFGASLAVTARAYARVGGMPAAPTSEDVALVDALVEAGARLRHSPSVRVRTSARSRGRAEGGLADVFAWWAGECAAGREPLVEPAAGAERRLARLGLASAPGVPPPRDLRTTPPATAGASEPLTVALDGLRRRIAALRPLPLDARLARAARLTAPRSTRLPAAA